MKIYIFLILFTLINSSIAQKSDFKFQALPSGLHFLPLKANFEEPHFGTMLYLKNLNLKVDIGNSIDIIKFYNNNNEIITAGIDFMAYALANSYAGHRLQIDALDGFFGGNIAFTKGKKNNRLLLRIRYVHNSSHFADGHYDLSKNKWIDNKTPIPFTRNFLELLIGREERLSSSYLRYYAIFNYSFLVRPSLLKRPAAQTGFELGVPVNKLRFLNQPATLFLAFNVSLKGIPYYYLSKYLMAGIKLGDWFAKGVNFYVSYYSGKNFFNEYFRESVQLFSIGFLIDYL